MFFSRIRNAVDYPLRQLFRWRRSGCTIRNEEKGNIFNSHPETERKAVKQDETQLLNLFPLDHLYGNSTTKNYAENLYYLKLFEEAFRGTYPVEGNSLPDTLRAADVGVSHWFYVQSLYAFLRTWRRAEPRQVFLEGYEVDAYRIYADLFSRADHAAAHMQGCPGTVFIPQAFSCKPLCYDLITLLFPFVYSFDHLEWGLPMRTFRPLDLLESLWSSLKPGGVLLVVNQGEEEHLEQKRIFQMVGIPVLYESKFTSYFFTYDLDRYILTSRR